MEALSKLLQQAMEQLMKGGGGGGGAGEMPTSTDYYAGGGGCVQYYQVTVPSSDPCAIYNPNAISGAALGPSGVSGNLLDALGGGGTNTNTQTNVSTGLLQGKTNTPGGSQSSQTQTSQTSQQSNTVRLAPGLSGDVRLGSAGATIIANLRQGLSEVASFFGGSTFGSSQSLSVAGRLCASRPWASGFIANVIPSSFFDGLCEWRGYHVGVAIAPQTSGTASAGDGSSSQPGQQRPGFQLPESDMPPEADIWAEPASVRLGTRTYIFWNARGVVSCEERGPSFEQNSLSGGASTVPISGPTTFVIECLTSASTTVRDSVTVQIAI
ncbi:hypothetical protein A3A38_01560 [Candidatus Kaiserbacteria bacterium RIFCSPLOWO2_01_FULL_53_17]|uniref:Uncharacterized protein n=1 Tax=Candidatus Kaiserbacteria bacterium RIFCSPLOWO2_01_FULL_53_17 TaxID=1798511 RepID=A0A1F6EGU4_9BACT|nr:MAG: hypothetical protein A3A38_01560 [Candidatus Kaiserbacteria bacterium RIFCSPLOWO2_01_FULL_53_17]